MTKDQLLLESAKAHLTSLESATTWVFLTLLIVVLASFRNEKTLEFASFKVERKFGGPLMYAMLVGINFQILKLVHNLDSIVQELAVDRTSESFLFVSEILHKHPWLFNPYSEYDSSTSGFFDNFGFVFLIAIWWIGNAVAFKLMYREEIKVKLIGLGLGVLYLVFGLWSMVIIQATMKTITTSPIKLSTWFEGAVVGVIVGTIIFTSMIRPVRLELKREKAGEKLME